MRTGFTPRGVVAFNADDLLEREAHRGLDPEHGAPIGQSLARASHNPSSSPGLHGCPPVPLRSAA